MAILLGTWCALSIRGFLNNIYFNLFYFNLIYFKQYILFSNLPFIFPVRTYRFHSLSIFKLYNMISIIEWVDNYIHYFFLMGIMLCGRSTNCPDCSGPGSWSFIASLVCGCVWWNFPLKNALGWLLSWGNLSWCGKAAQLIQT